MSEPVLEWLPEAALSTDAVKAASAGLIARWSERWFTGRGAGISEIAIKQASASPASWLRRGRSASAGFTQGGQDILLKAALGADVCSCDLNEGDAAVLNALCDRIVDDLIATFDTVLSRGDAGDGPQLVLDIAFFDRDVLSVSFAACAAVPLVKSRMGRSAQLEPPPQTRMLALAPTRVTTEAILGRTEIAFSELEELAPGDVLVLDRGLSEAVELRLGADVPVGRGFLRRRDGKTLIEF